MGNSDDDENATPERTNDPPGGTDAGNEHGESDTASGRSRRDVVAALIAAGGVGLLGSRPVRGETGDGVSASAEHWAESDDDGLLETPDYDGIDVGTVRAKRFGTKAEDTDVECTVEGEQFLHAFLEVPSSSAGPGGETETSPYASVAIGHESNEMGESVEGATIAGGRDNTIQDNYSTIAGGVGNLIGVGDNEEDTEDYAFIGGGQDNHVTGTFGTVGGGRKNTAFVDCVVGGGAENVANDYYATVGGGDRNRATGLSTVGGGRSNTADYGTISGGVRNTVRDQGFVGGGVENTAGGAEAAVVCGNANSAGGDFATVGGGKDNDASGGRSTIPGGAGNVADGKYSFAAGREALADGNDGTFVFGDSTWTEVTPDRSDQFVVQAGGGATIYSSSDLSTGVELPAGGGSWSSVSARAAKTAVSPVDPQAVLDGVESLDVSTWEYDSEEEAVHMGPMAEAFHDAFGLGADRERIATVDADGVALAAVQGLADRLDEEADALRAENERLRERCDRLEARLDALEATASETSE